MKAGILLISFLFFLGVKSQIYIDDKSPEDYEELKILSPIKYDLKNRNIKYMDIGYFDKKASYVKIYVNETIQLNGFNENNHYFDLNFEGDMYILKQNYPSINLPSPMRITSQNIYGQESNDLYDIRRVSIYPDSTIFFYSKNSIFDREKTLWGVPAKYIGNLKVIQEEISDNLKQNKLDQLKDSICVFEIVVTKEGELESGKLIGGDKSIFTQSVFETFFLKKNRYFEDSRSMWRPAVIYSSGRPINTKLKLYARLNKNGSVSIKLPNTLRNFTGS